MLVFVEDFYPSAGHLTPLNIVEAAALVGLGVSYAIGGSEGVEQYVDYITDPVEIFKDPKKSEALMQANRVAQAVTTLGGSEVARAGVEILDKYKHYLFMNHWKTGPYLPF